MLGMHRMNEQCLHRQLAHMAAKRGEPISCLGW